MELPEKEYLPVTKWGHITNREPFGVRLLQGV